MFSALPEMSRLTVCVVSSVPFRPPMWASRSKICTSVAVLPDRKEARGRTIVRPSVALAMAAPPAVRLLHRAGAAGIPPWVGRPDVRHSDIIEPAVALVSDDLVTITVCGPPPRAPTRPAAIRSRESMAILREVEGDGADSGPHHTADADGLRVGQNAPRQEVSARCRVEHAEMGDGAPGRGRRRELLRLRVAHARRARP